MSSELKTKSVKGITWKLLEKFGTYGIQFFIGIILARLLMPEDFGLIGMISVFFAIAGVFVEGGFSKAYIQKKEASDIDTNTVFFINLTISIFMYVMLWYGAPAIASFYQHEELIVLTRVMGTVLLINSFKIVQRARLEREVDFRKQTKIIIIAIFFSGIAGITAALRGLGVWSLVIQQMINSFVTTLGFWISSTWRPSFKISLTSFKSMFSFGFWILLSNLVKTIFDNIYLLTIGKFFGAAQLGYYTKAKNYKSLFSDNVSLSVGAVSFSILSKYQSDKEGTRKAMRKFLTHTMVIVTPLMMIMILIAKPFVILLLTEKWAPMIPYLKLLCVVGVLYPIHAINVKVLMAQGKSNLSFNLTLIKNGLRIINLLVMYRFGVFYIIVGEIIISFIGLIINTYYTKRLIDYSLFKQAEDLKMILIGAIIAGIITYLLIMSVNNLWLILVLGIMISTVIYFSFQYLFNRQLIVELSSLKKYFISNDAF